MHSLDVRVREESVPEDRAGADDRLVRWLLLVLTGLSLIPIWLPEFPPLQDLPNHLLKVQIARRLLLDDPNIASLYALNLKLLSNYTCYVVIFLLSFVMSLTSAAKVFLSVCVVSLPACSYAWLRRVNHGGTVLALSVPMVTFNLFLAKGNLNFCAALALYTGALALFAGRGGDGWRPAVPMGAVATVLYFTHGLVFLALLGTIVCLLMLDWRRSSALRALGLLPGLACFGVMILMEVGSGRAGREMAPQFEPPGRYLLTDAFTWLLSPFGWGPDSYLSLLCVITTLALAVYNVSRLVSEARAGESFPHLVREHKVALSTLALALVWCLAPVRLADWGHLRVRFVPLVALTSLGALRLPRRRWVWAALTAVFTAGACAVILRTTHEYLRGDAHVRTYLSGVSSIEPDASILPIDVDTREINVRANLHTWGYYVIAKGGWSPYLHAYPSYHPVVYQKEPWGPPEDLREGPTSGLAMERVAACYDYLLLWGTESSVGERISKVAEPYYQPAFGADNLMIWRNRRGIRRYRPDTNPSCERDGSSTSEAPG